jgi:hypothetical protein
MFDNMMDGTAAMLPRLPAGGQGMRGLPTPYGAGGQGRAPPGPREQGRHPPCREPRPRRTQGVPSSTAR